MTTRGSAAYGEKPFKTVSVTDYGAVGDGVTDERAALLVGMAAAAAANKALYFPAGTYLVGSAITLDSTYSGLKLVGCGANASIIKKGFSGNLFTLTAVTYFEARDMSFHGMYGTYTGKGFVFAGASNYPVFSNCYSTDFSDSHIEFGADSGYGANLAFCRFILGSGQTDTRVVTVTGTDTTAMDRRIVGCQSNGFVELTAAIDTTVSASFFTRVQVASSCSITLISGTTWANNGVAMTIDGGVTNVVGCRMSGDITLNAGMTGSFIGNVQTAGTFTNSSVVGNVLVHHHPLSASYEVLGKHVYSVGMTGAEIQIGSAGSVGDSNATWTPDSSQTTFVWGTAFTANRTLTLTTTGARNGMQLRVCRPAGDTGGPWTLTVGGTGKTLSASQWCDVQYNGSFWRVTAYGTL